MTCLLSRCPAASQIVQMTTILHGGSVPNPRVHQRSVHKPIRAHPCSALFWVLKELCISGHTTIGHTQNIVIACRILKRQAPQVFFSSLLPAFALFLLFSKFEQDPSFSEGSFLVSSRFLDSVNHAAILLALVVSFLVCSIHFISASIKPLHFPFLLPFYQPSHFGEVSSFKVKCDCV